MSRMDVRLNGRGACQVHVLADAARQLEGVTILEAAEADERDYAIHAGRDLAPCCALQLEVEDDVAQTMRQGSSSSF